MQDMDNEIRIYLNYECSATADHRRVATYLYEQTLLLVVQNDYSICEDLEYYSRLMLEPHS